jgi:hypothetical protein
VFGAAPRLAGFALAALALGACRSGEVGYVEIKLAPSSSNLGLYLDSAKLAPVKNGVAVLRQHVGTAKLQIEGGGGQMALLCDIVVRKNRITTVTVSALERPPRCHCSDRGSEPAVRKSCVG